MVFSQKMLEDGKDPPPPPMHVFVCEKNREGKSKLKMKGGGKEIKSMPEYTPLRRTRKLDYPQ